MAGQKNPVDTSAEAKSLKSEIILLKKKKKELYGVIRPAKAVEEMKLKAKGLASDIEKLEKKSNELKHSYSKMYDEVVEDYNKNLNIFIEEANRRVEELSDKESVISNDIALLNDSKNKAKKKLNIIINTLEEEILQLNKDKKDILSKELEIKTNLESTVELEKDLARREYKLKTSEELFNQKIENFKIDSSKTLEKIFKAEEKVDKKDSVVSKRLEKERAEINKKEFSLKSFSKELFEKADKLNEVELKLIEVNSKYLKDLDDLHIREKDLETNWETLSEERTKFEWEQKRKRKF